MKRLVILLAVWANCVMAATPTNAVRTARIGAFDPKRDHSTNVRTQGTVVDVFSDDLDPMYDVLMLKDESAMLPVFVPRTDGEEAGVRADWLDAEVSVEGVYENHIEGERPFTEPFICAPSAECVRVVSPAPAPFAVPELVLPGQYTRAEEVLRLGRRRVSGEVIAAWNGNRLLIRADVANDAKNVHGGAPARIRHHVGVDLRGTAELPPAGTRVTVDGYPVTDVFL
ncbi:MAG: hypothetical protein MJ138_07900, partial [Kiritimatiellae bacterium]|nr:hypothetical protein [Kiritimatiellia bacterium]